MMLRFLVSAVLVLAPTLALAQDVPNAWHPYRGPTRTYTNCVQVADSNGNFNCSSLVTINPTTGAFSALGTSNLFSPVFGALVVAPSGNTLTSLGNDVVLYKRATTSVAPSGPGANGVTFRIRPSPIPGHCRVVAIAGNAFGKEQEFPMAFLDPSMPFPASAGPTGQHTRYGAVVVDLPGGPSGC